MRFLRPKVSEIYTRDGFALVGLGWLLTALFGCLPYLLTGAVTTVPDALFESISGFSTTGASIFREVEHLPKGLLLWRSLTNWLGGMGVLALMLAVMPSVKADSIHIIQAEAPGPYVDKFVPRIANVARILYGVYAAITVTEIIFLLLGGMPLYDSVLHAFGTVSTGGFSNRNISIGAYESPYIESVITIFMVICGVNLSFFPFIAKGRLRDVLKDEEMRFYFGLIVAAILLITVNLIASGVYDTATSVRHAAFQVGTIITTTGFSSVDFNLWPLFSQSVLLLLMVVGGCAGSTAGGVKCMRILLMLKIIRREVSKILHPKAIGGVKLNGRLVESHILAGITAFFCLYMFTFAAALLVVSLDGFDLTASTTAVLSAISNIGPGLGAVGPTGSFADFSGLSKILLAACMLMGRLEIYPALLMCVPVFWKRTNI
jgi:trk system potassium uptake protein TrkH